MCVWVWYFHILNTRNENFKIQNAWNCLPELWRAINWNDGLVLFVQMKIQNQVHTLCHQLLFSIRMNSQRNSRKEIKSSFISFKLFFLFLNYMSLWICGHMRLLQLSNFDFQDVLQHSLKSTMDFWYKFIQPQTFSFPAFFSLSLFIQN